MVKNIACFTFIRHITRRSFLIKLFPFISRKGITLLINKAACAIINKVSYIAVLH